MSCETEFLQKLVASLKELRQKYPGAHIITKLESDSISWGSKYKYAWYEDVNGIEFFVASMKKKDWYINSKNSDALLKFSRKYFKYMQDDVEPEHD